MRRLLAAVVLGVFSFPCASAAHAGRSEEHAAFGRGDYATARREFLPPGGQGDALAQSASWA